MCKSCHNVFHEECSRNVKHSLKNVRASSDCAMHVDKEKSGKMKQNDSKSIDSIAPNSATNNDTIKEYSLENISIQTNVPASTCYDDSVCSTCNLSQTMNDCSLDASEMNYVLKFVLERIEAWVNCRFLKCDNFVFILFYIATVRYYTENGTQGTGRMVDSKGSNVESVTITISLHKHEDNR